MNITDLKERIDSLCTHVLFEYNGKNCGVDPFSHEEYDMWYGDKEITVTSIEEVMETPLFDGKSLNEIFDNIINLE